ncbi:HNH endonuclease [Candidatus Babeliales bacterium]|nr:HNH endonuclease [Candidatus Babeliales bacterium]
MARFNTRSRGGYRQYNAGSGWKSTHRTVATKKLGGSIYSGHHVHHINGIKTDNRPSNLTVLSASKHRALHKK